MDDERRLFFQILECLSDEVAVDSILTSIEVIGVNSTDVGGNSVIGLLGSISKFSALFERWISEQAQPFLIYRGHNNTIESNFYPNLADSVFTDDSKATNISVNTYPKKKLLVHNTKTRVAPTVISTSTVQNISVESITTEPNYNIISSSSNTKTNETMKSFATSFSSPNSKQQQISIGSLECSVSLSTSALSEVSPFSSVITTPSKIKLIRLGVSMEIIHNSTMPPLNDRERIPDSKIFFNELSELKPHDVYNNKNDHQTNVYNPPECHIDSAIPNMSKIYCALVRHQYIPISIGIPFLAKLAGLNFVDNFSFQLKLANPELFPTLLKDDRCLKTFVATSLSALSPVITALGHNISSLFANSSESLRDIIPDISTKLLLSNYEDDDDNANDDYYITSDNLFGPSNNDSYIRPFREEVDNRHEYKSQIETAVYNEREKCYDEFSNLIRQFISLNKTDLDGRKIEEFWQSLPSSGQKVLSIRDCNFPWFADVFKSMLLFYGLNTPLASLSPSSTATRTPVAAAEAAVSTPLSLSGTASAGQSSSSTFTRGGGGGKEKALPIAPGLPTPTITSTISTTTTLPPSKERLLEARMGPGGKGQLAGGRRPPPHNHHNTGNMFTTANQQLNQKLRLLYSSYQNPSIHFPGNQQFFFRFIVVMDCHRFCRFLASSLAAEISLLTGSEAAFTMGYRDSGNSASPEDAALNGLYRPEYSTAADKMISDNNNNFRKESPSIHVAKLRLLGRFLGLLYFWPHWSFLSIGERLVSQGPLRILASESNRNWMLLRDTLPIERLLDWAYRTSRLSRVIPWVAEFLKMMEWTDGRGSDLTNPYYSSLVRLRAIQYTPLFTISKDRRLSGNRMHVLIEIQETLTSLAFPMAKEIPTEIDRLLRYYDSILTATETAGYETRDGHRDQRGVDCDSGSSVLGSDCRMASGLTTLWPWMHDLKASLTVKKVHHATPTKSTNASTSASGNIGSSLLNMLSTSSSTSTSTAASLEMDANINSISSSNISRPSRQTISQNNNISSSNNNSIIFPRDASTSSMSHNIISNTNTVSSVKVNEISSLVKSSRSSNNNNNNNNNSSNNNSSSSNNNNNNNNSSSSSNNNNNNNNSSSSSNNNNNNNNSSSSNNNNNNSSSNNNPTISSPSGSARSQLAKRPVSQNNSTSANRINKNNGSLSVTTKAAGSLKSGENVLIASFWQQHPQLQQLSSFLLEQLHHALRARVKLLVAEAVHKAWYMTEVVRGELDSNPSLCSRGSTRESADVTEGVFKQSLEKEMNRIHASTMEDSLGLLEQYIDDRFAALMTDLTTLHPVHARVSAMATHLTRLRAQAQRGGHSEFLDAYLRRKLSEVVASCLSQHGRARATFLRDEEAATSTEITTGVNPTDSSLTTNKIIEKGGECTATTTTSCLFVLNDNQLIDAIRNLSKYLVTVKMVDNSKNNNKPIPSNNNIANDGIGGGGIVDHFLTKVTYNWSVTSLLSLPPTTTATTTSPLGVPSNNVMILNDLTGLCLSAREILRVVTEQVLAFQNTISSSSSGSSSGSNTDINREENYPSILTTTAPPTSQDKPSFWKSKDTLTKLGFNGSPAPPGLTPASSWTSPGLSTSVWGLPKTSQLIRSTVRYLLHLIVMLQDSMEVIPTDMSGRVKIEVCKLLTVAAPYLLFLDSYCNRHDIKMKEVWKPHGGNQRLSLKEITVASLTLPSDAMLAAVQLNLISIQALSRALSACCRSSSLLYFEVCRGLTHARAKQPQVTLSLLWRYLCQTQLSKSSSVTPQNNALLPLDTEDEWYLDPSLIRAIKTNICDDLADLVLYLSKLEA